MLTSSTTRQESERRWSYKLPRANVKYRGFCGGDDGDDDELEDEADVDDEDDDDTVGGRNRKNECSVVPPIATAAAPVVAVIPTRFPVPSNLFFTSLITADFPVPPGPVKSRFRRASTTIDIASNCSFEKVIDIVGDDGIVVDDDSDSDSNVTSSFSSFLDGGVLA
jgi:hypothetical protein